MTRPETFQARSLPANVASLIEQSERELLAIIEQAGLDEARIDSALAWALRTGREPARNGAAFLNDLLQPTEPEPRPSLAVSRTGERDAPPVERLATIEAEIPPPPEQEPALLPFVTQANVSLSPIQPPPAMDVAQDHDRHDGGSHARRLDTALAENTDLGEQPELVLPSLESEQEAELVDEDDRSSLLFDDAIEAEQEWRIAASEVRLADSTRPNSDNDDHPALPEDEAKAAITPLPTILAEEPPEHPPGIRTTATVAANAAMFAAAQRINDLAPPGDDDEAFDLSEDSSPGGSTPSYPGTNLAAPNRSSRNESALDDVVELPKGIELAATPPPSTGEQALHAVMPSRGGGVPEDWVDDDTDVSFEPEPAVDEDEDDVQAIDEDMIEIVEYVSAADTAPPIVGDGQQTSRPGLDRIDDPSAIEAEKTRIEAASIDLVPPSTLENDDELESHSEFDDPATRINDENTTVEKLGNDDALAAAPRGGSAALIDSGIQDEVFDYLSQNRRREPIGPSAPAGLDARGRPTGSSARPASTPAHPAAGDDRAAPSLDELVALTETDQADAHPEGKRRKKRQTSGIFKRLFGKK